MGLSQMGLCIIMEEVLFRFEKNEVSNSNLVSELEPKNGRFFSTNMTSRGVSVVEEREFNKSDTQRPAEETRVPLSSVVSPFLLCG